jgi:hypothetical protein
LERGISATIRSTFTFFETAADRLLHVGMAAKQLPAKKPEPEQAILDLKVCDPACGSGHFLVAAARRIARRLAQVRSGDEEPSPTAMQHALRDVVGKCLFGVDLNPMAVELCKVSLWMEALEPGRPLTFLDGHIQCGNSLLGATPALLRKGIPDEAFDAIEGDDKKIASALKKRNKAERKGQTALLFDRVAEEPARYDVIAGRAVTVEQKDDASIETLRCKERLWKGLVESAEYRHAAFLADAWCAAFVWPKVAEHQEAAITEDLWQRMKTGPDKVPAKTRDQVEKLAAEYHFFHWHLAFPQVFRGEENEGTGWDGGFDCVLGNPPWEKVQFEEREFLESLGITFQGSRAAERKELLRVAAESGTDISRLVEEQRHQVARGAFAVSKMGHLPLSAKGKFNRYALFTEQAIKLPNANGRVGIIVKSGIATALETKELWGELVLHRRLHSLVDFENRQPIFMGVAQADWFCLLTIGPKHSARASRLAFGLTQTQQIGDAWRFYELTADQMVKLNPNTLNCATFKSWRDAAIVTGIYDRCSVLDRHGQAPPFATYFKQYFNETDDAALFQKEEELLGKGFVLDTRGCFHSALGSCLPLIEPKNFNLYDHRFGTFQGVAKEQRYGRKANTRKPSAQEKLDPNFSLLTRYWVDKKVFLEKHGEGWNRGYLFSLRGVSNATTNARTAICSIVPHYPHTKTAPSILFEDSMSGAKVACLVAMFSSFPFDYISRQKIGGTHLNIFVVEQFPVVAPETLSASSSWSSGLIEEWIKLRVLELVYTAWDLVPFARDVGYDGPPFRWDEERRFLLRAELDAAFFHLYGIARDDVDYIMETFPIVKRKDEKAHGEYRTKRGILEIYDEMQKATDTGVPYQTRLDPPAADPRVAHPDDRAARRGS